MISPIPVSKYANAPLDAATANGVPINISKENAEASIFAQEERSRLLKQKYQIIIVPGFTPVHAKHPYPITSESKKRLDNAVIQMQKKDIPLVIVSGGNVHPKGTPYNEAYGMKQYLLEEKGLKNHQVAIDPYARHSTTNLRNTGRFLLAHEFNTALVVTSPDQSFYYSHPFISTFNHRCKKDLGYVLGKLSCVSFTMTKYKPNQLVFTRGSDPLDP
jgi:hypothetical protein